jgi:hypothetical protein
MAYAARPCPLGRVLHGNARLADASCTRLEFKYGYATRETDMTTRSPMRPHHATYPFRLRDPVNGRLVRARFIAQLKDIADCCAAWEILAPARPEANSH